MTIFFFVALMLEISLLNKVGSDLMRLHAFSKHFF